MDIGSLFPMINDIKDSVLKEKTKKALEKAIKIGKWKDNDILDLPFTLLIPELLENDNRPLISLVDHINAVTKASINVYNIYTDFKLSANLNRDYIISGALLHDVGKFIEYEKDEAGKIVQSLAGKILRHPAQGLELVNEFNFPLAVRQAIVFHSKEGKEINLLPEVEIISRSDFLCFVPVKKILQR
jgi:putative nucleotidyltransferase with HDIG domain